MARCVAAVWLLGVVTLTLTGKAAPASGEEFRKPNILWLTCEDTGPQLGCYGDTYARTPNLDALAARGTIYTHCWSNAPVCAPARTALISGMYPPSTGAEHMRSMTRLPDGFLMYPQYLRQAGYYCTNNSKEDYNLEKPGQVWDESSAKAHWRNRRPGQPFFAVFNFTVTHESQIRSRPHTAVHDASQVRIPGYHPDAPETRQDWAQYYDKITEMDALAGKRLRELDEAGLADETIVFFYGDHGPGMPRCKRWPYDSGLHVPLIVCIPSEFRQLAAPDYSTGGKSDRLVSFVDLAPTLLSLAGCEPPGHFQGRAFLGPYAGAEPEYVFGFRGRMDERYDLVRSARDRRYVYLRHFMPHKIYGQHIGYMFETPTTRVWKRMYDEGKLSPAQARFWERKPAEELYDLQADPDEVRNLAASPDHQEILQRFRGAVRDWMLRIRDVGLLPEHEIHARSAGSTPYEMGHDDAKYPLARILETAELASRMESAATPQLVERLGDSDSAVRYWAVLGLLMRGNPAVADARPTLLGLLDDPAPCPRVAAAEVLATFGSPADRERSLAILLQAANAMKSGVYVSMLALNAIESVGNPAEPLREAIAALPLTDPDAPARSREYVGRLVKSLTAGDR